MSCFFMLSSVSVSVSDQCYSKYNCDFRVWRLAREEGHARLATITYNRTAQAICKAIHGCGCSGA